MQPPIASWDSGGTSLFVLEFQFLGQWTFEMTRRSSYQIILPQNQVKTLLGHKGHGSTGQRSGHKVCDPVVGILKQAYI